MLDNIIDYNNIYPYLAPYDGTILELFKKQVEKYPHHPAVKFGHQTLTYIELDEKSDVLSEILNDKGIEKDTLVGLFLPRSIEFIVGLMGILKAGGAYVPMDPNDAKDRLNFIIRDSACEIILSKPEYSLPREDLEIVNIDLDKLNLKGLGVMKRFIPSDSLAYVIYTSGTTGYPKGTLIEHKNLFSMTESFFPQVTHQDRVLQCMSNTSDFSVGEIFLSLCHGATLVLWPGSTFRILLEEQITYILVTPSMAELINPKDCIFLKTLVFGGERLTKKAITRFPFHIDIYNGYGPTECTFASSITPVTNLEKIHIGDNLFNSKLYVVDKNLNLCPTGEKGELLIGGEGVGRGYLNLDRPTRESFLPNPFGPGRVYRTGDLVRWANEKELEFHGRADRQVKLQGFRIELEGLEEYINDFPGINRSYTCIINEKIMAYVTPIDAPVQNLKKYLKSKLPSYSLPFKIIALDSFVLNSSGKIDTKNLKGPDFLKKNLPETSAQIEMAAIWSKILCREDISLTDNFIDLGGTSLNVLKLVYILRKKTGNYNIDSKILYDNLTLKAFTKAFEDLTIIDDLPDKKGELIKTVLKVLPSTFYFVFGYQLPLYLFVIFSFINPLLWPIFLMELIIFRPFFISSPHFFLYLKNNLGLNFLNFKSVEIKEEFPIDNLKGHIFCLHPHGLTDIHAYPVENHLFKKGLKYRISFMKNLFYFPFFRSALSLLGYLPSVEKSYEWVNERKYNFLTTPGDIPEFLTSHHPLKIVLSANLNFFKIAIKNGMPLVPVLAFNAHKSYKYYPLLFKYRNKLRFRSVVMPIQPFRGKWFLPIPFKTDLKIVFGKPIKVSKNANPTLNEINMLLEEYSKALRGLFKRNAPANYPQIEIK